MSQDLRVSLFIRAIDQASAVVKGIQANFKAANASISKGAEAARATWAQAGDIRNAAEGVSKFAGTIKAPLIDASNSFAEFEHVMAQVGAQADNLTAEKFDLLKEKALQMGADTAFSATEAAGGMLELAKASMSTEQVMKSIGPILHLATAETMGIADASTVVIETMHQFGKSVGDIESIADTLSAAASASTTDVHGLAESLKYVATQANGLKVSLPDTAAALTVLANAGIKGSQAGTSMGAVMRGLVAITPKARHVWDALKINTLDKTTGDLRDYNEIFGELSKKMAGMGTGKKERVLKELFQTEGLQAAQILMESVANKTMPKVQEEMNKTGVTQMKFNIMSATSKQSMDNLGGSFETLGIRVGEQSESVFKPFRSVLSGIIGDLGNWVKAHPALTKAIVVTTLAASALATVISGVLFTATAVIGFAGAMKFVGGFTGAWKILAGPVTKAIAGVVPRLLTLAGVSATNAAAAWSMIAPFAAVGLAIGAVSLAVFELTKHWDALKESFTVEGVAQAAQGLWESLKDEGILATAGGAIALPFQEAYQSAFGGSGGAVPVGGIPQGAGGGGDTNHRLDIGVSASPGSQVNKLQSSGDMDVNMDAGRNLGGQ